MLLYGVSMSNRNALGALVEMTPSIATTPIIMLGKYTCSYIYMLIDTHAYRYTCSYIHMLLNTTVGNEDMDVGLKDMIMSSSSALTTRAKHIPSDVDLNDTIGSINSDDLVPIM